MLLPFRDFRPTIAPCAFVEASARIIGDVEIGAESSVWFNVVIRGDVNSIRIGARTNVQDGSVIHVTRALHTTRVGDDVTIGHNATLHGCAIGDGCLIGIGAIILDGAEIGAQSLVAAGTLVAPGTVIPPRTLVMGSPGRPKRPLTQAEVDHLAQSAVNYVGYRLAYLPAE
ncbi:MAG: gamma carbonic anhydrase family protein [Desulfuromonadales bacterium]|nr:gamma carbonic anhydrase family protein [Desulfuromonadales bacterium]